MAHEEETRRWETRPQSGSDTPPERTGLRAGQDHSTGSTSSGADAIRSAGPFGLHEERLVARKDAGRSGEVVVRKIAENVPGRLEVESARDEVILEHVPVGRVVAERVPSWQEDGDTIVPIYEEQLVVVKRLVMREKLRVRRVRSTETHVYEDTLRRERISIEDPSHTGLVCERYATDEVETSSASGRLDDARAGRRARQREGVLARLIRRSLLE